MGTIKQNHIQKNNYLWTTLQRNFFNLVSIIAMLFVVSCKPIKNIEERERLNSLTPSLTSVSPSVGVLAGGTLITINGSDFASGATVLVDASPCTGVSFVSESVLTCTVPAHAAGAVSINVTNTNTQVSALPLIYTYQGAPTLTGVSQNSGAIAGGTSVTLTGTGFLTGVAVLFDTSSCTSVAVVSSTSITCTTPAHAAGAVTVTVTNTDTQTGLQAAAFTYAAAPVVTSVSPTGGAIAGGAAVTITGTDFVTGATVLFDTLACTSVVFVSATSLTCVTPAHAVGAVSVSVTNPDTQAGTTAAAYTYQVAPVVTSVAATGGALAGGTAVTITGTGFLTGAAVLFDASACTGITVVSLTSITCTTPVHIAGAVGVTVTNADTQTDTLAAAYTYQAAPSVTSVAALTGTALGGTAITITGTDFISGATVLFDTTACTSVVYVSATSLTCVTPAHAAGAVGVTVTNPDAQADTQASAFTYIAPPVVTSVTPSGGNPVGGTAVTITGTDFVTGATVLFDAAACTGVVFVSATSLTCTTPAHAAGAVSVTVTNPDTLNHTLAAAFTYQAAPTVTSVAALTGFAVGGTAVTVTGTGFLTGATVLFDASSCTSVVVVSLTSITCTTPAHAAGAVTVTVTNADTQTGFQATAFTYIAAPVVTSVSPTGGAIAGAAAVTITGTDFVTGATVLFDTLACTSVVFVSATSLTCVTPAHAVGAVSVSVTNPDTQVGTTAAAYTYQVAPVVTSVAATGGALAGGTAVTITGTGFLTGAAVLFDASACTGITVVSLTSITCTTPVHIAGAVGVTVTNADTQTDTLAAAYTYQAAPTLTSVAPLTGSGAGGTAVTITGTDFITGATVLFDTTACTSVVFVSATSLTCVTPTHAAGAVGVTVTNPDSQLNTQASAFTYVAPPVVVSVTQNAGNPAGGTAVTITGTDFVTGATVLFDAAACTGVVFVNATSLTCTTPAHVAGAVSVTVTNPDTLNHTLAAAFTYQAAPTVSSVASGSGPTAGGALVTITGTDFITGATVLFDAATCTGVTFISSTSLTCTTPAHVVGAVSVTVTNPDTQLHTQAIGYIYAAAPTVTSISPLTGALAGGTAITVTGTGFLPGAVMDLGGTNCSSLTVVSATSITCTTGAHATGAVTATVTNSDTQTGTQLTAYTYLGAPVVTSITANTGFVVGGNAVTINGTDFVTGATVLFDAAACTGVAFVSATQLTCTTPAHAAGLVSVTVTNPDTQLGTLASAFTYNNAPTVTSVTPGSGALAGGTSITINGTGFVTGATVLLDASSCASVVFVSSTALTCITPTHAVGAVTLAVTNPDTQVGSLPVAYSYIAAPTVTSLSTAVGPIAGGTAMTITGTGFLAGATVLFGATACTGVTIVSVTSITCTTAAAAAATVAVSVTNTDSQVGSLAASFTYQGPPVVTSVSLNAGTTAGGVSVVINGTDFVTGATVLFDASSCTGVAFVSSIQLTCTTPAHAAGAVNVTVTNPDTQNHTLNSAYTYQGAPTVTSIALTTGYAVGGQSVTITGTGFITGASVLIDASSCTSVTVVSATSITCTTPAHAAGTVAVTVTNADTQNGVLGAAFTYVVAPTVTSVSVSSGTINGGTDITVTGTDFTAGAFVYLGGSLCTSIVIVSGTSITCTTGARASATVSVDVINTDLQTGSLASGFTYQSMATLEWQVGAVSPNPPNPDPYGSTSTNITHTFTLKNVGDITSSTITISKTGAAAGAWFFGTDNCSGGGNELAAGGECTVQFTFLGSILGTGAYSALLEALAATGGLSTNDVNASVP